jgi:ABC-2 type transport system permease protein
MSLSVFLHFARLRMKERMEYRAAYVLGMFAQILAYAGSYLVLYLLLQRFESIAGWGWPEVAFLYSLNLFTYAVGAAFTFSQMTALEKMVTQGTFDVALVRPLNAYAYLAAQHFNVGYLAHVLLAGGVLLWTLARLPVEWTVVNVAYLVAVLVSGSLVQAALITLQGAWAFAFVRSGFLLGFFSQLREFISYPISVYGTAIQVLLTGVLPLAFINYYPAAMLLSKRDALFPGWLGWLAPLVGPAFFAISYRIWMRGVDAYQGAGG